MQAPLSVDWRRGGSSGAREKAVGQTQVPSPSPLTRGPGRRGAKAEWPRTPPEEEFPENREIQGKPRP